MSYVIRFAPCAERDMCALPRDVQHRVAAKIETLSSNPRPRGVEKLKGDENTYRVRVGDYRILYRIADARLLVLIIKIGDRKEIYRG